MSTVDPFVVRCEVLHNAQVKIAKVKNPVTVVIGQVDEQVGNRFILYIILHFIAITRLDNPKRFACQANRDGLYL